MKDIILFDLDGTITDPKEGITKSLAYALAHFDINVENLDDLCKFIGPSLQATFCKEYNFNQADSEKAITLYRERFADVGIYENLMYDGMDVMLDTLKRNGKTIILATAKPTVFAEKILAHFNIAQYFSFVSGSELNGDRSDKKEIIEYALDKMNITEIDRTIMVGDRKYDIDAANDVKMDTIGVLYGYGDLAELTKHKSTYIAKDVEELTDIILKI